MRGAEIACGEIIAKEERRYSLASLFGGLGFGFLFGVEVTEMRMAGAARSAALAAIGKGESTQAGTVFGVNFGHGSSPEKLDLKCRGSLAEGAAHYFTGVM